jgi:hypothetical protein
MIRLAWCLSKHGLGFTVLDFGTSPSGICEEGMPHSSLRRVDERNGV